MHRYILRRLIFLVFVIIGITALLFVIMYFLPGDPARAAAGPGAKPEQVERIRIRLGLDQPLHIQYLTYMKNLVRGDLGNSIRTRKPVIVELKTYLPASLELVLTAMLFAVLVAIPLGVLSAMRPGRVADATSRLFAALGMGMPIFWVALMAQLIFYGKLDILPFGCRLSTGAVPPEHVTGFYLIDSLLAGDLALFKDAAIHLILPALVLALPEVAVISRLTRSSMLDVLTMDYIRTARAKGLRERRVIGVHALKNAFLAPLTLMGMQVGWLLAGSLLVESVFSWGGIGFLAYHAIYKRDFPVLMGVTIVMCIVFVLANLVVDILYSYLDPRISH
jgi:peptide/nickel transport system permease protein